MDGGVVGGPLGSLISPNDPKFKRSVALFKKNSLIKDFWKMKQAKKDFGGRIQNVVSKVKGKIK
jgi:hypothetical protein